VSELSILGNLEPIKRFDIYINVSNTDIYKILVIFGIRPEKFSWDNNKIQPSGSIETTMR
jgi:hypothetical protein